MRAELLTLSLIGLLSLACGLVAPADPTVTPTLAATATATDTPQPTATLVPTATPTPLPNVATGEAIVVGGLLRTRLQPSSQSEQVGVRNDKEQLDIAGSVQGENWLLGTQTWLSFTPDWASQWFELSDGSYVYGPFVFFLGEGEISPLEPVPDGVEKWIDVDLSEQRARAMVGDQVVFDAGISSGAPPFDTKTGSFAVEPDGRLSVERMTASQAGYEEEQATYDVERVLFTQYFDRNGNALHLNYWRPHSVFGHTPTSHGCVGMELHEAQYFWLFADAGTRVEIHK